MEVKSMEVDGKTEQKDNNKNSLKITQLPLWKIFVLVILCVGNLLVETWMAIIGPFYPSVASKKEVSYPVIGIIFASFQFTVFVSSPIFGSRISKIGAKFLLVSGLLVSGSSSVLFGFMEQSPPGTPFIVLSLLTRCIEALGSAAFLTSGRAIASRTFPDNVAMIYGILNIFTGIGLMAGFPLGGILYQVGGFGAPFWSFGTAILLCGAISIFVVPSDMFTDTPVVPDKAVDHHTRSFIGMFRSPSVCVACFCLLVFLMRIAVTDTTYAVYLEKEFGLSPLIIGLSFLAPSFAYTVTSLLIGWILDKKGYYHLTMVLSSFIAVVAAMLWGPSPLLTPLKPTIWLSLVFSTISAASLASICISGMTCILIGVKELGYEDNIDTHGMVSGCYIMFITLGTMIGSTFGGLMIQFANFQWSLTVMSGLLFCCGLMALVLLISRHLRAVKRKKDSMPHKLPLLSK